MTRHLLRLSHFLFFGVCSPMLSLSCLFDSVRDGVWKTSASPRCWRGLRSAALRSQVRRGMPYNSWVFLLSPTSLVVSPPTSWCSVLLHRHDASARAGLCLQVLLVVLQRVLVILANARRYCSLPGVVENSVVPTTPRSCVRLDCS